MSWSFFLKAECQRPEYRLTPGEIDVVMCLQEDKCPNRSSLREAYIILHSEIEEEAFIQRLRSIFKRFQIGGSRRDKLPLLHRYLTEKYYQYKNNDIFFSEIGLNHIHPKFPRNMFGEAIDKLIGSSSLEHRQVDILQTFAPNLDDYFEHLVECVKNNVQIRIILAWPYSEAARLREEVLRKYTNSNIGDEINIRDCVIRNLETLAKLIRVSDSSDIRNILGIRLYDTLPSLAIYRAGNYMLAAPFLHGLLAIDTFQLELTLNTANPLITRTLQNDFELMWQLAKPFNLDPNSNWINDLKVLFARSYD